MTLTAHKIWQLPLLLLALWLGGCAMQFEDFDEPVFVAPGDLSLVMDVHTGDRSAKATRATNDEVSFEPTTIDREKINTLRVIIVKNHPKKDAPDTIIHNDYRDLTVPSTFVKDLKYKVEYASNYTVYLIGNEGGLSTEDVDKLKGFVPGNQYKENSLEDITIGSTLAGQPMLSSSDADRYRPVPMTEFFEVKTITKAEAEKQERPDAEGVIQNETFFITRAASKFSFYFFRAEDFTVEETDPWTISKIKVSGLGQNEFLFPNSTEYFPTKESDRVSYNRDIKAFKLPEADTYQTGAHTFTLPTAFNVAELPVKTGTDPLGNLTSEQLAKCQLIPEMYFPESKGTGYTGTDAENQEYHFDCTISFGNEDFLEAVKLPNLPHALPRNTHVVVIVTIHDRYITATVDVIPFTEVPVTTSDYGLEREQLTGYIIGKDAEGNTHWYDVNHYASNVPDPLKPAKKYYLGPSDHPGEPVTINGKEYMLVYADLYDPVYEYADVYDEKGNKLLNWDGTPIQRVVKITGYDYVSCGISREASYLDHFYEVFIEKNADGSFVKDENGQYTVTAPPVKHLLTPEAITGYDFVMETYNRWVDFYVNKWKKRVTLEENAVITQSLQYIDWTFDPAKYYPVYTEVYDLSYPGTFNEWEWNDYAGTFWNGQQGNYPKCWYDILGNANPMPTASDIGLSPAELEFPPFPTFGELGLSSDKLKADKSGFTEQKDQDTWDAAVNEWQTKVQAWNPKFKKWVEAIKADKKEQMEEWKPYLEGRILIQ